MTDPATYTIQEVVRDTDTSTSVPGTYHRFGYIGGKTYGYLLGFHVAAGSSITVSDFTIYLAEVGTLPAGVTIKSAIWATANLVVPVDAADSVSSDTYDTSDSFDTDISFTFNDVIPAGYYLWIAVYGTTVAADGISNHLQIEMHNAATTDASIDANYKAYYTLSASGAIEGSPATWTQLTETYGYAGRWTITYT